MVGFSEVGDGAITLDGLLVDGEFAVISFDEEDLDSDRVLFLEDADMIQSSFD